MAEDVEGIFIVGFTDVLQYAGPVEDVSSGPMIDVGEPSVEEQVSQVRNVGVLEMYHRVAAGVGFAEVIEADGFFTVGQVRAPAPAEGGGG